MFYLKILKSDEDKLNFLLIQIEQQINSISSAEISQIPSQSNVYHCNFHFF